MPTAKEQRFIDYVLLRLDVDPYVRELLLTAAGADHADVSYSAARGYLKKMLAGPLLIYANLRRPDGSPYSNSDDYIVAREDRVDYEEVGRSRTLVPVVRDREPHDPRP